MARYVLTVVITTDDHHADAPTVDQVANEIRSHLQFDTPGNGILAVSVRLAERISPWTHASAGDSCDA